jgi:hypothetical protein
MFLFALPDCVLKIKYFVENSTLLDRIIRNKNNFYYTTHKVGFFTNRGALIIFAP